MGRIAAKIKHDEIVRMVKAVKACGLPVSRVTFDGERVDIVIGDNDKLSEKELDHNEPGYL